MTQTPTPPSPHPLSHRSHWAAFSVLVRDGGVEIAPHPRDPNPSPLLGNIAASVSHRARIARPMVRRGWLKRGLGTDRGRGRDAYGAELLTKKGAFWVSGEQRAEVWGRPAITKHSSLLVADDTGRPIWQISYKGPPAEHAGGPAETTGSAARKL